MDPSPLPAWDPAEVSPLELALTRDGVESACFPTLFERGLSLADGGKVQGVELSAREARGRVQGGESEPYDVAIGAEPGDAPGPRIGWSTCTCKFAQSNATERSLCKHMAALALVAGAAYRLEREAAQIARAAAPAPIGRAPAPRL